MKNKPHKTHQTLLENAQFQVIRLEGQQNYTKFVMYDGSGKLMSYSLKNYDNSLTFPFIRVNKSCIVNLHFCETITSENKKIILKDGYQIQVSRRKFGKVSKSIIIHN